MTCGPWRGIFLESITAHLTMAIDTSVTEDHSLAIVKINTSISSAFSVDEMTLEISITDSSGFHVSKKISVNEARVVTLVVYV